MKAPQIYRLERMVYNGFNESGMDAASKRRSDSDSPVKAFIDTIPQVPDPILTLLRFEPFLLGWKSKIEWDREQERNSPEQDQTDGL